MPKYKITIEYDGTNFVGWQRQENGESIQSFGHESKKPVGNFDSSFDPVGR